MPQIFQVGGSIRDFIMGVKSKDIDFTYVLDDCNQSVEAGFSDMTKHLQDNGFEIFLSTPDCFTIRARFPKNHVHAGLVADFVMSRKEMGYVSGTRKPILALGSLHDDLLRRDFTVNAIAQDLDGTLIDPFGGVYDIEKRVLITPLDPMITFMDDPLRVLRCCRFSITKGFKIHSSVMDAMSQPDLLEKLKSVVSGERIREEVTKMMAKDTSASLRLLHKVDAELAPGFLDIVFSKGLWLKPTFEKSEKS
jgi:poly(A) polymerase